MVLKTYLRTKTAISQQRSNKYLFFDSYLQGLSLSLLILPNDVKLY